jgi:hypothetical protein
VDNMEESRTEFLERLPEQSLELLYRKCFHKEAKSLCLFFLQEDSLKLQNNGWSYT